MDGVSRLSVGWTGAGDDAAQRVSIWSLIRTVTAKRASQVSAEMPIVASEDDHEICRLEDSPVYVIKAAGQGLADVVETLLNQDSTRVYLQDNKGWTCLHHAASRGRLKVVQLLLGKGADINAVDNDGNTALHVACEKAKTEIVSHLLMVGADASLKNVKGWGAVHVAAMHNNFKTIEAMAKVKDKVDMKLRGMNGCSALHVTAMFDFPESTQTLLRNGCRLCIPDDNGFYPIHTAAKNASLKTLEVLLKTGEALGYTRHQMLGFCDKESNGPLHSAVNSGDYDVVKICLNHGARIDAKQDDQATAFHLACSQGTLAIVQLMFDSHKEHNADTADEILFATDICGMTPLHRAAMYDHPEVVKFLLDKGSDIDALDNERRSALLLAAIRGGSATLKVLMENGASLSAKDVERRNVLHFLVTYGGQLIDELHAICKDDDGRKLLNQKDSSGCTPLHVASKQGNLHFTETLITLGATINLKNNDEQSPLHFAARYGRVNTVRRLLRSECGTSLINEIDGAGMTALHVASMEGHTKVVQQLLHKGALLHRDFFGRTPLHLAAKSGYTQTMRLLLSFHAQLLDQKDKIACTALHTSAYANKPHAVSLLLTAGCEYEDNSMGRTALDICIECAHAETATAMVEHPRWNEILTHPSTMYICPLLGLIQFLPEVHRVVLDRSHTSANLDPSAREYWEKYDFGLMQLPVATLRRVKKAGLNAMPLLTLNTMVRHGRVELLSHPVCLTYLKMKWKAYGLWFYYTTLLLYCLFVLSLSAVIGSMDPRDGSPFRGMPTRLFNSSTPADVTELPIGEMSRSVKHGIMHALLIFMAINVLKEILQIFQQGLSYFLDTTNFTEWALYISTLFFVFPMLFMESEMDHFRWQCGAVAVFLAWFNLLLYLQRLTSVGIYVVMFLQILSTVVRVIAIFSILFIAFGQTFHILLINDAKNGFDTPFISTMHSVLLMMGDWDFVNIYIRPYASGTLWYPTLTVIFMIGFIVLMPILFINLLIGLAVGDIEMVLKDARLKGLAMQVEYYTGLEERMPAWLLKRIDKTQLTDYPNKCCQIVCFDKLFSGVKLMSSIVFGRRQMGSAHGSQQHEIDPSEIASEMIMQEVTKTKNRLKEVQAALEKQSELLRLVVQKMEIVSEADQFDEGAPRDAIGGSTAPAEKDGGGFNRPPSATQRRMSRYSSAVGLRARSARNANNQ